MGNVTAKTSGEIASFMTPAETNIKSLKVHFSPKQLGTGDPSPENVREIEGWDGVEVNGCGKNIAHIVGYSATTTASPDPSLRKLSNNYGTTINTTDFSLPDTKIIVTQSSYTAEYDPVSYRNGYFTVIVDNLDFTKRYNVSFNVDDIINNPLNVDLSRIRAISPAGTGFEPPAKIDGNRLFFKNVPFTSHSNFPNRKSFEIRNAGMSFTLSEFMVTPVDDEDFEYKPYQGMIDTTNWSDDVGTAYGGYIDLISGELVEEWGTFTVDEPDSTWRVAAYNRITINFPRKYIFGSRLLKDKSMCTILPENHTDWNYGYIDNVASVTNPHALSLNYTGNGGGWSELFGEEATNENVKSHLQELGFAICATLATPITHQLTPTQLSSFIGQNNFWSNADYVEIEYELKETEDIQKVRKKIILNQPHIESVNGDIASFTTDMKAPLKECKVSFMPVQEGEGDPSPDNMRNITGWNGVEVKNDDNVYSIDWTNDVGTVYGGYVDLIKGELVSDMAMVEFDGSSDENWQVETLSSGLTNYYMYATSLVPKARGKQRTDGYICSNMCIPRGENETYISGMFYFSNSGALNVYLGGKSNTSTVAEFKSWLTEHKLQVAYWLAEPIHYSLTPQQILSLKGINNFSCGIKNDLSVRYWNYKKSNSSNIAYEAKNLTFDGTNYIDTGVYLFSEKNINRDFEVVIEDLYGGDPSNLTIVCAKYDSTAIGFLIRNNGNSSTVYNGTISMKRNNYNNITIKRVNGAITISGSEITNPKVKFTNAVHQHPLVLGCALQDDGTPFRYATGTIGHITVKWL